MAIEVDFLANERDFVRGTGNVEKSLEKVADSLDDVAGDSQRSARKMGDHYEDAARDVDRSNERLERSFKELAASSRKSTQEVGDDLARNTQHSTQQASESVREFGDEAKANIAETFSSFRGDASDFAQIVQDTLGGLAGGLTGIPAIAAVAAGAAGIGLLMGAIENGKVESEAWKAEVADLAQAFIDAGGDGEVSLDRVVEKLKDLASNADDSGVTLSKLRDLSQRSGHTFKDIAQAYAGNSKALRKMIEDGDEHARSIEKQITTLSQYDDAERKKLAGMQDEVAAWNELGNTLDKAADKADEAAAAEAAYNASGAPAAQAHAETVDAYATSVQQSLQDAASAWEDYNNDGKTSLDEYNAHIEEQITAITRYQTNVKAAAEVLSEEAMSYLLSLGEDAAPILQAFIDAPLDQQQRTAENWASIGRWSSGAYKTAMQNDLNNTLLKGPRVVIDDVNTSQIVRQVQQTLDGHTFTVNAWANVRVGNAVLP